MAFLSPITFRIYYLNRRMMLYLHFFKRLVSMVVMSDHVYLSLPEFNEHHKPAA